MADDVLLTSPTDLDKKVEIKEDKYGIMLSIMKNGWQWTVTEVDEEILDMIYTAIQFYKNERTQD